MRIIFIRIWHKLGFLCLPIITSYIRLEHQKNMKTHDQTFHIFEASSLFFYLSSLTQNTEFSLRQRSGTSTTTDFLHHFKG
jgi:hypothetical protein